MSEPLNSAQIVLADGIAERVVATLIRTVAKAVVVATPPPNEQASIGHNGGPAIDDETAVFSVPEFCAWAKVSRSTLYSMWAEGTGPKSFKAGVAVRISRRAAKAWLVEREAAAATLVDA